MKSGTSRVGVREYQTWRTIAARLATYASVDSSLQTMNSSFSRRVLASVTTVDTQSGRPRGICFSHQPSASIPFG